MCEEALKYREVMGKGKRGYIGHCSRDLCVSYKGSCDTEYKTQVFCSQWTSHNLGL